MGAEKWAWYGASWRKVELHSFPGLSPIDMPVIFFATAGMRPRLMA